MSKIEICVPVPRNSEALFWLLKAELISNVAIPRRPGAGAHLPTSVYFLEEAVAFATVIVTRKAPEILR